VAMLSWGQRKTIINKSNELFGLMDNKPYDFVVNHKDVERKRFAQFKHRTFQYTDTLYFLEFLRWYYNKYESLETAFSDFDSIENALTHFHDLFFSLPHAPTRTTKHIATPKRNSSCKRLNMFLRWMVRKDAAGVDFGLWPNIAPSQLMIPLDVHVQRVALNLNLLQRTQRDWKAVIELTNNLKKMDANDPVKYDYALFGLGIQGKLL
jgi:uncharacterized protein (TIGR02757 family)